MRSEVELRSSLSYTLRTACTSEPLTGPWAVTVTSSSVIVPYDNTVGSKLLLPLDQSAVLELKGLKLVLASSPQPDVVSLRNPPITIAAGARVFHWHRKSTDRRPPTFLHVVNSQLSCDNLNSSLAQSYNSPKNL